MGIFEKMYNVMCEAEAIEKNMTVGTGSNSYKAVSEAEILNTVKPLFKKHRLIIFPVDGTMKDNAMVYTKKDNENAMRAVTELKVTYRIVDIDSKEHQDVVGFGNGADSQDKGAGKAFTYSLKNALSKTFMLFSGEDTDNDHSDDLGKLNGNSNNKPPAPENKPRNDSGTSQGQPSDLEKRATAIYYKVTGNKEGQLAWPVEEYKKWLKGFKDAGVITTDYGKKWTKEDIEFLEKQIETLDGLPF